MVKLEKCSVSQFKGQLENKKLVCFCAGYNFYNFCEIYDLGSRLLYVVDNFKQGSNIRINNYDIPVIAIDDIGQEIRDCILVLTSIRVADEMIAQMDEAKWLDGLSVYISELFVDDQEKAEWNAEKELVIPKTIHYFWFGNKQMPETFQKNIETWRKYCPDYEIKCWNESNYDISKNQYMKQAYEAKKWGFVPDYARLDILYNYGGIYLDTDVEVLKPLDDLLKNEFFCGFESMSSVNLGQGFGSVRGNKILEKMMESYTDIEFVREDGSFNLVPSPVYQTQVLCKMGLVRNGKTQKVRNALVLAAEYMAPINEFGFGFPTENTFSIHHYAATWYDENQKEIRDKVIANYKKIIDRMNRGENVEK